MSLRLGTGIGPLGSAGMVSLWNNPSMVRSIQHGSTIWSSAYTGTSTIAAVKTENTFILFTGFTNSSVDNQSYMARPAFTSTSLTWTRNDNGVDTTYIYWVVVELEPGVAKSIQMGSFNFSGGGGVTATVARVNKNKTMLLWSGYQGGNVGTAVSYNWIPGVQLTNDTTCTGIIGAAANLQLYFTLVEFY